VANIYIHISNIYVHTRCLNAGAGPTNEPGHGEVLLSAFQSVDGNNGIWLLRVVRFLVVLCISCSRGQGSFKHLWGLGANFSACLLGLDA